MRKPDGPHTVSLGNELRTAMMLKLGGRRGLVDWEQIGGHGSALLGCFDCRTGGPRWCHYWVLFLQK